MVKFRLTLHIYQGLFLNQLNLILTTDPEDNVIIYKSSADNSNTTKVLKK